MKKVQILDKKFALSIPEKKIRAIKTISEQIIRILKTETAFVSILNGSFMFASDLITNYYSLGNTFIKWLHPHKAQAVTEILDLTTIKKSSRHYNRRHCGFGIDHAENY